MAILEMSITPLGKGESVSQYVARAVQIIDESGLDYQMHAMGTNIEGEIDQLLDLLRRCFDALAVDCDRITCTAKIDYRKGRRGCLESKLQSVEDKLDRRLKKA